MAGCPGAVGLQACLCAVAYAAALDYKQQHKLHILSSRLHAVEMHVAWLAPLRHSSRAHGHGTNATNLVIFCNGDAKHCAWRQVKLIKHSTSQHKMRNERRGHEGRVMRSAE